MPNAIRGYRSYKEDHENNNSHRRRLQIKTATGNPNDGSTTAIRTTTDDEDEPVPCEEGEPYQLIDATHSSLRHPSRVRIFPMTTRVPAKASCLYVFSRRSFLRSTINQHTPPRAVLSVRLFKSDARRPRACCQEQVQNNNTTQQAKPC